CGIVGVARPRTAVAPRGGAALVPPPHDSHTVVLDYAARRRAGTSHFRGMVVRGLVLLAVVYSAFEIFYSHQIPVIALGHFTTLLAAAKFLELRTPRDRLILVVIALLAMVMGAMVSANITFAVVLLLYMTVGLRWMLQFRMTTESEAVWDHSRHAAMSGGAG